MIKYTCFAYCLDSDENEIPTLRMCVSTQLLHVWSRLRNLVGLPVKSFSGEDISSAVFSLSVHLRINCLPFLRTAAFVIHLITQVEVPQGLRNPVEDDSFGEFLNLFHVAPWAVYSLSVSDGNIPNHQNILCPLRIIALFCPG